MVLVDESFIDPKMDPEGFLCAPEECDVRDPHELGAFVHSLHGTPTECEFPRGPRSYKHLTPTE